MLIQTLFGLLVSEAQPGYARARARASIFLTLSWRARARTPRSCLRVPRMAFVCILCRQMSARCTYSVLKVCRQVSARSA